MNKLNSHNGKYTGMFISNKTKAKKWFLKYYYTFYPRDR